MSISLSEVFLCIFLRSLIFYSFISSNWRYTLRQSCILTICFIFKFNWNSTAIAVPPNMRALREAIVNGWRNERCGWERCELKGTDVGFSVCNESETITPHTSYTNPNGTAVVTEWSPTNQSTDNSRLYIIIAPYMLLIEFIFQVRKLTHTCVRSQKYSYRNQIYYILNLSSWCLNVMHSETIECAEIVYPRQMVYTFYSSPTNAKEW